MLGVEGHDLGGAEVLGGEDAGALRGGVLAAEYLGTTQIVTLDTEHGEIKARLPASWRVDVGDSVGLDLDARSLSLFDTASGRALATDRDEGARAHG